EINEAIAIQKEVVKENIRNLESYKKLGKMYGKIGETGMRAFVNGEQLTVDVPPVIKEGRTLIPFRAISESLDAT
ncbi:stalk domain-containing protein, partial [Cohnella sp. REN36]